MSSIFDFIQMGLNSALNIVLQPLQAITNVFPDWTNYIPHIDTLLYNIPTSIFAAFIDFFLIVLYPFYGLYDIFYGQCAYVWYLGITLINVVIGIPNFGLYLWGLFFIGVVPTLWGSLFFISIAINVCLRIYAAIRHMKTWVYGWGN